MSTPESQFNSDLLTAGSSSFVGVEPEGTFENSVERGFSNTKASFGAASEWLGARIGTETIEDWGEDYSSRMMVEASLNPAELASYEDVDSLADVGTYIQEKVGENISILASMAAGAGVGGLGAAGLRAAVGKTLLKKAATDQGKKALKRQLFSKTGARVGGSTAVFPQLVGESAQELKEAGVDLSDTDTPLLVGMINTALEVAPMEALLRFSFGGVKSAMARDVVKETTEALGRKGALRNIAKKAGGGAGLGVPLEGITETSQELVNIAARAFHDPEFDPTSPEAIQRLEEAFVAGATVGGSLGAGGGALGGTAQEILKRYAPQPANPELQDKDIELDEAPADQSQTAPDSPENLAGQFDAVLNSESSRDSVLVTPGEQAPFSDEEAGERGFERVDLGSQGALFTTNPRKAETAREKGDQLTERDLNNILFNNAGTQNKAQSTGVAVGRDEAGRIVSAIGYDSATEESAVQEAQSQVPGGQVTRESVETVVDARRESADDRKGQAQAPTEAQGGLTPDEDAEAAELLGGNPDSFVQSGEEQAINIELPRRTDQARSTAQSVTRNVSHVVRALDGADPRSETRPARTRPERILGQDVEVEIEPEETTITGSNDAEPGIFSADERARGKRFEVENIEADGVTEPDRPGRPDLRKILGTRIRGALPPQSARSVEASEPLIKALVNAAANGVSKGQDSPRIAMLATPSTPPVKSGDRKGQQPLVYFDTVDLATVGHILSGKSGRIQDLEAGERSTAAASAVAYLQELGFGLTDTTIEALKNAPVSGSGQTFQADQDARDPMAGKRANIFHTAYEDQLRSNSQDEFVGGPDTVEEAEATGAEREADARGLESDFDQAQRSANAPDPRLRTQRDPLEAHTGGVVNGSGVPNPDGPRVAPAPTGPALDRTSVEVARERLTTREPVDPAVRRRVLPRIQGFVDQWQRSLNLSKIEVVVLDDTSSTVASYDPGTGRILVGAGILNGLDPQNESIDETRALALEVLAHEFGHAVQHQAYEKAPGAIKQRLKKEHEDFLRRTNQFDEADAASRRAERAPAVERESLTARRGASSGRDPSYDTKFREWFADQVARVIMLEETSIETPSVRQFFAKVADQIRRVYDKIRQVSNIDAAPSVHEFVNNLRGQAAERASPQSETEVDPARVAQLEREADGINGILKTLGFKGTVQLADNSGVQALRGRLTSKLQLAKKNAQQAHLYPEDQQRDLQRRVEIAQRNLDLMDQLHNDEPMARVVFLRDDKGAVRPLVYISNDLQGKPRDQALLHETGHVLLRQFMSNLSAPKRKEIEDAFGARTDYETFEENFAHGFLQWAEGKAAFGQLEGDTVDASVRRSLRDTFASLWDSMRKLWQEFRKKFSVTTPYSDFMEQIANRRRVARGETPVQPRTEYGRKVAKALREENFAGASGFINPDLFPAEYLDMSVAEGAPEGRKRAYVNKITQVLRDSNGASRAFGGFMGGLFNRWLRPLESVWRNVYNMPEIADALRRLPHEGSSTSTRGDIFAEQRQVLGQWERRISEIVKQHTVKDTDTGSLWDRIPGFGKTRPTPELQDAMEQLEADAPETSPLAIELREIFNELREYQLKQGVYVPMRKNYMPRAANMDALQREGGYSEFMNRVKAWAQTREALEFWSDEYGELLTEERADKFGDALYSMFTGGEGVLDETTDQDILDFTSPGMHNHKQRVLPDSLWTAIKQPWETSDGAGYRHGFQEDNVAGLLVNYSRAAVKRGVWQRRFGVDGEIARKIHGKKGSVMGDMIADRQNATTGAEINDVERRIGRYASEFKAQWGVDPRDPSAGLKLRLRQAVKNGEITAADQEYAATTLVPQMQGVLNADFSIGGKPRTWARRGQAAMLVYQNMRVLALAPFAQAIDWALIYHRIPSGSQIERDGEIIDARKDFRATTIRAILNKATRQELFQIGELLGAVQNDHTETVLNDEAGAMMGSRRLSQANETFFRVTGMQFLTNFQRAMAAHSVLRLVEQWSKEGNAKELGRLNITLEQANAWVSAGKPKHFTEEHHAVTAGVNQFIDEGSLRPTPGMKPRAGNDQRLALLWHLNSFIYVYQQQIHGRLWREMKERYGEEEGAAKMKAALPALTLAAVTLPFTAVAMQLRWLIDPPEDENRPEGWEWFWSSLERSGMLGVGDILVNAYTADQFGKFAVMSPLGPTVGQLIDLGTDDFSTVLSKGYPFQQVINGIGDRFD